MTKVEYNAERFLLVQDKAKFFVRNFSKSRDRIKAQYRAGSLGREDWLKKDAELRTKIETIQKLFR